MLTWKQDIADSTSVMLAINIILIHQVGGGAFSDVAACMTPASLWTPGRSFASFSAVGGYIYDDAR